MSARSESDWDLLRRFLRDNSPPDAVRDALEERMRREERLVQTIGERDDALAQARAVNALITSRVLLRDDTLSRWFAHYPNDIFPDVPLDQLAAAVEAIQATGITSDRLYGAWARHILFRVMIEIHQADAEVLRDPLAEALGGA